MFKNIHQFNLRQWEKCELIYALGSCSLKLNQVDVLIITTKQKHFSFEHISL